jgi:hypothetical protein
MRVYKQTPAIERLWRYVQKTRTCWLWCGAVGAKGYGVIKECGKMLYVHRVVLEGSLGRPLGSGMFALHKCDVRSCIRPSHLFEGTIAENNQDMHSKGRASVGSAHYLAVLSEKVVLQAIEDRKLYGTSYKDLAAANGVSLATMHNAMTGRTWKHLNV